MKKSKVSAYTHAHILNCLFHGPKSIAELSDELRVHKETIRKPLRKMHEDGLVHISEYRISELRTNQPTMVFAFGPGEDAPRITFGEMQRKVRIVERPNYVPKRDPFIAMFFGEAA